MKPMTWGSVLRSARFSLCLEELSVCCAAGALDRQKEVVYCNE